VVSGLFGQLSWHGRTALLCAGALAPSGCGHDESTTRRVEQSCASIAPEAAPSCGTPANHVRDFYRLPRPVLATDDELLPEAGFIEVEAHARFSRYPARMFYSFHPADSEPTTKPLLVFFNGGPGFPTTLGLLPYGTTRQRIDPEAAEPTLVDNPNSWTRFANLLYIDERQVGFSYGLNLPEPAADIDEVGASPVEDAADFVRTVLRFLHAHPAILSAPVVLVGESYGGMRALLMLNLLHYPRTVAAELDPALAEEIEAHHRDVFPCAEQAGFPHEMISGQFGSAVLIQPYLLGPAQLEAGCGAEYGLIASDYDTSKLPDWLIRLESLAVSAWSSREHASRLFGLDPADVALLGPADRPQAFRRQGTVVEPIHHSIASWLGPLTFWDAYYVYGSPIQGLEKGIANPDFGLDNAPFQRIARFVRLFVTDARHDRVVCGRLIVRMLGGRLDLEPRDGEARPGRLRVPLDAVTGQRCEIEIRYPEYDAGHMVTATRGAELGDDVEAWLREP
jgi:hypothetical protein